MSFDRAVFFNAVRGSIFHGSMTQQQVDGMNAILDAWEVNPRSDNLRHLSYPFATTAHETGFTMAPIEEYGKGKGMAYGQPDPETGQTYYGRGYVQLTWRDNYARADEELGFGNVDSLEWHAERALDHHVAAQVMFEGMCEGWFRSDSEGCQDLDRYFNEDTDDSYGAREIINGDKHIVPSWSGGVSIGNLIKGYHIHFLAALEAASMPAPMVGTVYIKTITITSSAPIQIVVEDELVEMASDSSVSPPPLEPVNAPRRDRSDRPENEPAQGQRETGKPVRQEEGIGRVSKPGKYKLFRSQVARHAGWPWLFAAPPQGRAP